MQSVHVATRWHGKAAVRVAEVEADVVGAGYGVRARIVVNIGELRASRSY